MLLAVRWWWTAVSMSLWLVSGSGPNPAYALIDSGGVRVAGARAADSALYHPNA